MRNKQKGITLIALVVTIVVLLILAGVSLMTLTGENGLITRTTSAKEKMSIAEAQEVANLEYMNGKLGEYVGETTNEEIAEAIAEKLHDDYKYETKYVPAEGAIITGAELYDGDVLAETTKPIPIKVNSEESKTNVKTLKVKTTTEGGTGDGKYYVEIDGLYHEIKVENGVTIDKEGKTEENINTGNTNTRTVKMEISGLDSTTKIQKEIVNEGNTTYEDVDENTEFQNGDTIRIVAGTTELTGITIVPKVVDGSTEIKVGTTIGIQIIAPLGPTVAGRGSTFSTGYGKIEVVWLDKSNNIISSPLVEVPTKQVEIEGQTVTQNLLTPIKLNSDGTYTENPTGSWYNYAEKTGTTTSDWANAINPEDKSFFVWIPRYAYRITYYASKAKAEEANSENNITGYYDGNGMWNKNEKKVVRGLESGIETVDDGEKTYIVHPAFMKDTGKKANDGTTDLPDYDRGGWSENLAGIWMAKYEMSMENGSGQNVSTTYSSIGNKPISSTVKAVSKPGVSSWRYINIANMYTNSYNYNRDLESHLMKNSEWGAVAYLTHSQYGRNGEEIRINNNSNYITGSAAKDPDASYSTDTNAYNTTGGMLASSTGNITGIYDLSGGAYEYVAAFNKNYTGDYFGTNSSNKASYLDAEGSIFAKTNGTSSKYATAYSNNSGTSSGDLIYTVGITGDATKEVYTGTAGAGWFSDYSSFVYSGYPFFKRGGYYDDRAYAGVFYSYYYDGNADDYCSFRVVLAP